MAKAEAAGSRPARPFQDLAVGFRNIKWEDMFQGPRPTSFSHFSIVPEAISMVLVNLI